MPTGSDSLKHIVVLMMNGRSFDHMLGGLRKTYPNIDGLTGNESNPDPGGATVSVQPIADFQLQLARSPDNHFPAVDVQIFGGAPPNANRTANMQGFVKSYFTRQPRAESSHNVMYYFPSEKLPVLASLATEFAVFNGWFSSIPGPMICNRRFAHYGTSFGQVGMDISLPTNMQIPSIYERMLEAGRTAKIYYYDQVSSSTEMVNRSLLKRQASVFAPYSQFVADCHSGNLPDYAFVEPNYNDHAGPGGGQILASDQYPSHNIQEGERFIANTYNAIRTNLNIWKSTALLIVYSQHGGLYDHVAPPKCTPDDYVAEPDATGTGERFAFDRLGVRVPAILVSPWIPRGTIVPGPSQTSGRTFEHASIPATVTQFFLNGHNRGTNREKHALTFLDLLGDEMRPDDDCIVFQL
jgi:phospholipase C